MKWTFNTSYNHLVWLIISCGILSRLIPHLPNFSPEIVFALYLGIKIPQRAACLSVLSMAIISDLLISWQVVKFSFFGTWSLFTYSALLLIAGWGIRIKHKGLGALFVGIASMSTFFYWLWTNFGTWLMTDLYPHSLAGIWMCYELALPFLTNSLAASLIWGITIVLCERSLSPSPKIISPLH